jgi:hypothetical protein
MVFYVCIKDFGLSLNEFRKLDFEDLNILLKMRGRESTGTREKVPVRRAKVNSEEVKTYKNVFQGILNGRAI